MALQDEYMIYNNEDSGENYEDEGGKSDKERVTSII